MNNKNEKEFEAESINQPITEMENFTQGDDKAIDPFDPERLRLSHDFASSIGVKKALLTIKQLIVI